jgi:hypothetical protein
MAVGVSWLGLYAGAFVRISIGKVVFLASLFAMPAAPAVADSGAEFRDVVESVLQNGLAGELPPHLSLVLGAGSGEMPLKVKQAVLRTGTDVRVFSVCVINQKDIVILRTNEQARTTKAYLFSPNGKLRNAVFYQAGGVPRSTPAAQASAESAAEIKFWTGLRRPHAPGR